MSLLSITVGHNPDGLNFPQWFEVILRKHEPFKSAAAQVVLWGRESGARERVERAV